MICPHCNQNLLYKERSGKKCSKCKHEFAFEPKTDSLGLHDARFRKVIGKIGADGKVYFTSGQLQHFLSRKKIKNSVNTILGWLVFASVASIVITVIIAISTGTIALFGLAFLIAVVFVTLLITFRQVEGDLNLTQSNFVFESDVIGRWRSIYKQLPANLLNKQLLSQNPQNLDKVRAVLVCPELEVRVCLLGNQTSKDLGLLLFDPYQSPGKSTKEMEFIQQRRDLPIFVLHDASIEGCLLKEEFVRKHLGNDRSRKVYDIGLRPQTAIKAKLMRLRAKPSKVSADSIKEIKGLAPEEIAWLENGNYTPLLALTPTHLIKYVTRAVNKGFQISAKTAVKSTQKNDQSAAQAVGFMTWLNNG
ncbi:MAG: hypothetical protein ABI954_13240 [Pyrinomonadaceae bacterium]